MNDVRREMIGGGAIARLTIEAGKGNILTAKLARELRDELAEVAAACWAISTRSYERSSGRQSR